MTVMLEVTSAFVVDGRVAIAGERVRVLRSDAAALVARGKAVVVDPAEPAVPADIGGAVDEHGTPVLDEVVDETGQAGPVAAEPVTRGRRRRS